MSKFYTKVSLGMIAISDQQQHVYQTKVGVVIEIVAYFRKAEMGIVHYC